MRRLITFVLASAAILVLPATSVGREPPSKKSPCSRAGKNICDTSGVGFYQRYRYGLRWFGDYRGAVTGADPSFCIDLRWWYPSADYDYKLVPNAGLKNTNGKLISAANQARMNYAIWTFGRSNNKNQQAATMLYVHSLMGDAAPGEVDPRALNNPTVLRIYNRIATSAGKYRGPYSIKLTMPANLTIGKSATAQVRVISATGNAVPGIPIALASQGASGIPAAVRTNSSGVGSVTFTPTSIAGLSVFATTDKLAANLPRIYKATTSPAAQNAQRMAAAASQTVSATAGATVAKGAIQIATKATPNDMLVGEQNRDEITVGGVPAGSTRAITVKLFGPFANPAAISCAGAPVSESTVNAGTGVTRSQPFAPTVPGWYQYQLSFGGDDGLTAITTSCDEQSERFRVRAQPRVTTVVQSPTLRPGGTLQDRVKVEGLAGQPVTVKAVLYGPFGTREAIKCDAPIAWSGTLAFAADGEQLTAPATLTTPGYYTYHESIEGSETVKPVTTTCADVAETAIVIGTPTVTTAVSSQSTSPGSQITDKVIVNGLGPVVPATVQVELWGPYDTTAAMSCSGTPFATQTFTATGDGTYTTEPITITKSGYFVYRESLAGGPANDAAATTCGEAAETTLSTPKPTVYTQTTESIRPGQSLSDTVVVSGLGQTPATVELKLYGPFASRTAITCTGTPVWTGTVAVPGDGTYRSAAVRLPKVGFYSYQERLVPSGLVPEVINPCGRALESVLVRPLILTGPGDPTPTDLGGRTTSSAPSQVQIAALNINAPVSAAGIGLADGALAVPSNVRRLGWWRDGAAPGDANGTTLIAGHVDSAKQGAGSFNRLKSAKAGMKVRVTTADGTVRTYRVTKVQRILKASLPATIFTQRGARKLVLVTCGGPFNRSIGHYRDNIVVTAVPA